MTWNPNVPDAVISPRRYRVRVRVYRAGKWVDITSRVASGVIRESNDQPVATLELRLLNGREYPSIAPRRKDSPLNQVNGRYVPLLWIGRLIAVDAAFSEDGSEPDEWWPVFLGELEDEIDTESGPDGTYVRLFCRDMATRLQRAYIAGPWTFENMYASEMIQAILDHAYSEDLIPEPVQLRLIGPDDFWVERYDIEYTDLWSALQRFCQQRGTDLRYRLNEVTGQIELTYWLPDRVMVPDWTIDASQVRREELRISGTDIINKVTVRYRDAQTGQRAEVTVQDEDSIAMYGLRHGLIEEPDTDLIPDQETAQKLAQTIVEDLKDVPALTRLTVPFDPRIQLFDKLQVTNPNVRDEAEDYAIESRELQFSAADWSMVLVGGGRVTVKRQAWLERLATEGVKQPFTPGDWITNSRPPAVTITLSTGLEEVEQGTTAYVKASWQRPDWRYIDRYAVRVRRLGTDEYQYQETTETSATFYGLLADADYGVQVATIDGRGTVGEWSTEATIATPRDETAPAKPTGLVAIPVVRGFVLTWDRHSPPPPLSHWIVERASSADGFQTWVVVNAEVRSALYTDQDPALDQDLEYRYRVIAVSRAGIHSAPSDPTPPRKPGKVSLAEDVVDQLKREYLDQDFVSEIQDAQSRLEQAESGLQEAQDRLSDAEQRLGDAEDRLGNAETQLAEAEDRLGAAEQRLATAENQLVDAKSRLADAEERLEEAEQALEQVEDVVQEHTVTLQTHAQEIAARVTQQVFDSLEQRVTDAEAELSIHAEEIQARVEQTVFDALKSTVESHTATLQVHAQEIAARVTQEVFDTLADTVSQHEATLQVHADAIAAKVEQIVFDALADRVSQAEAELAVHADEIQARVKQEDFDDLEDRVTQAESTLTLHADQIATKVEQSVVDTLEGRVSQAETAILQKADKIELTALSQEVDTIEQRVTTAETTLTQKADKIELSAVSEEVDTLGQRVTSAETTLTQKADKIELNAVREDLDELSGTVATHEATLQTHAQQIAARVTQEVFDVLEGRVTEAEAELNILADEIEARVEKTVFDTLAETVAEHSATLDIHADEIAARVKQTVFDTLEERVTDAEATLQVHAGEIAARVTQATFDALEGRVTQAETAIQQKADKIVVTAIDNRLQEAEQDISSLAVTAQEISTAVANVQDGLTQAQSAIQQNANQIALRVMAKDANGNPITNGEIRLQMVDGKTFFLINADQTIVGTLRVTGEDGLTIESGDGSTQLVGKGLEVKDPSGNVRVTIGNLQGLPWGETTLSNTYGIHIPEGGLYAVDYPRIIKAGIGSARGITTLLENFTVPAGKAWVVHFQPFRSEFFSDVFGPGWNLTYETQDYPRSAFHMEEFTMPVSSGSEESRVVSHYLGTTTPTVYFQVQFPGERWTPYGIEVDHYGRLSYQVLNEDEIRVFYEPGYDQRKVRVTVIGNPDMQYPRMKSRVLFRLTDSAGNVIQRTSPTIAPGSYRRLESSFTAYKEWRDGSYGGVAYGFTYIIFEIDEVKQSGIILK